MRTAMPRICWKLEEQSNYWNPWFSPWSSEPVSNQIALQNYVKQRKVPTPECHNFESQAHAALDNMVACCYSPYSVVSRLQGTVWRSSALKSMFFPNRWVSSSNGASSKTFMQHWHGTTIPRIHIVCPWFNPLLLDGTLSKKGSQFTSSLLMAGPCWMQFGPSRLMGGAAQWGHHALILQYQY